MFVGIAAERIEVSIADPEQQESVLRFVQPEPGKALAFSERLKVEVEIRTELAFLSFSLVNRLISGQTWVVCAWAEVQDGRTISAAKTIRRTSTLRRGVLETPPSCYLTVLTRRNPR